MATQKTATKEVQDFDELYPGRFIKAGDLKGQDRNLTIAKVWVEELEGTKKQMKGVIAFKETPKDLVLNRTNGECLKALFGRRLLDWVGKRITIYPAKIDSDLADLAIRVRGSPDIDHDVTFTLSLARKRPREVTLKKTASAKGGAKPAHATEPDPEPEVSDAAEALGGETITDPNTGEEF